MMLISSILARVEMDPTVKSSRVVLYGWSIIASVIYLQITDLIPYMVFRIPHFKDIVRLRHNTQEGWTNDIGRASQLRG